MKQIHANGRTIGELIELIQEQKAFQLITVCPTGGCSLYVSFWDGPDALDINPAELVDGLQTALDRVIAYKAGDKCGWHRKYADPISDDLEDQKCSILK
jgi:hypothetical protein